MSGKQTILRVSATYPLTVEVGDTIRRGEIIQHVPDAPALPIAPTSGTVQNIQFDPASHEFIIVIAPAP